MATKASSTKTSAKAPRDPGAATVDAIVLLKADHAEVKNCFLAYDKLVDEEADSSERQQLAEQICAMLSVHATIEEEIFYPATREALGEDADLIDEAEVEHASAKDLIAQIRASSPDEDLYDAKVKVLGEYIDHHVLEEHQEIFPKAKKAGLDLAALGASLAQRKQELAAMEPALDEAI